MGIKQYRITWTFRGERGGETTSKSSLQSNSWEQQFKYLRKRHWTEGVNI